MRDGALEREHQAFMGLACCLACGLVRFMRGPCGLAFSRFNLIDLIDFTHNFVTHQVHQCPLVWMWWAMRSSLASMNLLNS